MTLLELHARDEFEAFVQTTTDIQGVPALRCTPIEAKARIAFSYPVSGPFLDSLTN